MFQFTNDTANFYVQLKGNNAGKPLKERIPNSIGIKTNPEVLNPAYLYYTLYHLYSTGAFKPFVKGSVIPYIRQQDITIVLINHWYK